MTLLRRLYDELFGPPSLYRAEIERMNEVIKARREREQRMEKLLGRERA